MTIEKFINEINSFLPSVQEIKVRYANLNLELTPLKIEMYFLKNTLQKYNDNPIEKNILKNLIENTNLHEIGIGQINFFPHFFYVENSYLEFASYNDYYNFCITEGKEVIYIFDYSYENMDVFCNSFRDFFSFLIHYNRYDKNKIYGVEYSFLESADVFKKMLKSGFSYKWLREFIPEYI